MAAHFYALREIVKELFEFYSSSQFINLVKMKCQQNLVKPKYPRELIDTKKFGAVNVLITLDEKGKIIYSAVTSGFLEFHKVALQAIRKSIFKRTIRCGKFVKVTGIIVYNFISPDK